MRKKQRIPSLSQKATCLFFICLGIIFAYLIGVILYIKHHVGDPYMQKNALEMLHGASISAVISLGGSLLFDCEMRHSGKIK